MRSCKSAAGRREYQAYVEELVGTGEISSPWEQLKGGRLLGMDDWVAELGQMVAGDRREQPGIRTLRAQPTWDAVREIVAAAKGEPWENFVNRKGDSGRDVALLLACRHTLLTHGQLARLLGGLDDSAVAHAVRRIERRAEIDPDAKRFLADAEQQMSYVKM